MADSHGHGPSHDDAHGHAAHAYEEPAEDALRTPGWLPFAGFGLVVTGALWVYLFLSPGVLATPTAPSGGDAAVAAEAAHP